MTLDKCEIGKKYTIYNINCTEDIKRRFLDFGLIPSTEIIPVFKAPFGDLIAYKVRGTIIAIRNEDSRFIEVKI